MKGAALVVMFGMMYVPPWDMPENTTCEARDWFTAAAEEAAEVSTEDEVIVEESEVQDPALEYLGSFDATAYEWTGNPCANGNYPTEGYTIACNSLPLGTEVYIEGIGYRVVEDRGADWHVYNWLDLYMGDEAACYEWGVRTVEVYVVRR